VNFYFRCPHFFFLPLTGAGSPEPGPLPALGETCDRGAAFAAFRPGYGPGEDYRGRQEKATRKKIMPCKYGSYNFFKVNA
jgi:hypothetical protein